MDPVRRTIGILAFACLLTLGPAVATHDEGPLAHWTFDEGVGGTAGDATGHGHDGTIFGSAWVETPDGHGLALDGVDDHVVVASPEGLRPQTLTVVARVVPDVQPLSKHGHHAGTILRHAASDANSVARGFGLQYQTPGGDGDAGRFVFIKGNGGKYANQVVVAEGFPAGAAYHVAAVYEHPWMRIYIDGSMAAEAETSVEGISYANSLGVFLGKDRTTYYGDHAFYRGTLDDVVLYDRALAPEDVARDFDAVGPTVELVAPARGDVAAEGASVATPLPATVVAGTVTLQAVADDDKAVARVDFVLDGERVLCSVVAPPYACAWDTRGDGLGEHVLEAVAVDVGGNAARDLLALVVVDAGASG